MMNLFLTNTLFKTFLKRDSAKVTHHKGEALTFVVTAVSASEALRERERERERAVQSHVTGRRGVFTIKTLSPTCKMSFLKHRRRLFT